MAETNQTQGKKLAVVLVRGLVGVKHTVKDTIKLMNLTRVNQCVIIDVNPINLGMLKKAKDYITWGEIDDKTFQELVEKRGQEFKGAEKDLNGKYTYNKYFEFNGKKYKKVFCLNPPKKGFGRKGIKQPFKMGGALGDRGMQMVNLVKRML